MTTDNENAIVKTIATLAKNLGMQVIAEGIETEEQYQRLKELGCEYGQGYLFSRPVDADSAFRLLAKDSHRDLDLDVQTIESEAVVAALYPM